MGMGVSVKDELMQQKLLLKIYWAIYVDSFFPLKADMKTKKMLF